MEAFDYKLYETVVNLHPNASKEVLLAEYAKHLQVKKMIENSTYSGSTPILDITPKQIDGKKSSKKDRIYRIYTKKQLKMGALKDTLDAIEENQITCLLCGEKMKALGRHLYSAHQCSVSNYKQICGYDEKLILAGKSQAAKSAKHIEEMQASRKTGSNK